MIENNEINNENNWDATSAGISHKGKEEKEEYLEEQQQPPTVLPQNNNLGLYDCVPNQTTNKNGRNEDETTKKQVNTRNMDTSQASSNPQSDHSRESQLDDHKMWDSNQTSNSSCSLPPSLEDKIETDETVAPIVAFAEPPVAAIAETMTYPVPPFCPPQNLQRVTLDEEDKAANTLRQQQHNYNEAIPTTTKQQQQQQQQPLYRSGAKVNPKSRAPHRYIRVRKSRRRDYGKIILRKLIQKASTAVSVSCKKAKHHAKLLIDERQHHTIGKVKNTVHHVTGKVIETATQSTSFVKQVSIETSDKVKCHHHKMKHTVERHAKNSMIHVSNQINYHKSKLQERHKNVTKKIITDTTNCISNKASNITNHSALFVKDASRIVRNDVCPNAKQTIADVRRQLKNVSSNAVEQSIQATDKVINQIRTKTIDTGGRFGQQAKKFFNYIPKMK